MPKKSEKTASSAKRVILPSRIQTAAGWKRSQMMRRRGQSSQKKV